MKDKKAKDIKVETEVKIGDFEYKDKDPGAKSFKKLNEKAKKTEACSVLDAKLGVLQDLAIQQQPIVQDPWFGPPVGSNCQIQSPRKHENQIHQR